MTEPLAIVLAFLLIAVLITIHEFGHFLVAKAFGIGVKVFSIGIGGRAFGWRWKGTDYRVSWFPFGGYVRMAGADPFMEGGADEEDDPRAPDAFMSKAPWKRLLVVLAGPVMNLVLPFVVFTALYVVGEPQPRSDLGMVHAGTPAEAAGLRPLDRIVEIDGTPVATWYDVQDTFEKTKGDPISLVVDREGARVPVSLPVDGVDVGETRDPYDFGMANAAPDPTVIIDDSRSPAAKAGLESFDTLVSVGGADVRDWNEIERVAAGFTGTLPVTYRRGEDPEVHEAVLRADPAWAPATVDADDALWRTWGLGSATVAVQRVEPDSAATAAGLVAGDRILAIDDRPVRGWLDVTQGVAAAATGADAHLVARAIHVTFRRDGEVRTVDVTPRVVRDTDELGRYRWRPLLGIAGGGAMVAAPQISRPYALGDAFVRATRDTTLVAGFIVEQIGKLFTNEAAVSESLGGPVEIFRQTKAAAELGIKHWARQLGLFSISLGVINLLPIPVLDGGQLVMYLAEWIRGRPLPLVLRERAQQAGVIFLVLLMLFVLVNDIHRAATG